MQVQIQLLTSAHDRTNFTCGEAELEKWFKTQASQQQGKNTSRTFVIVDETAPAVVLGFYALTVSEVDGSLLPLRKLPEKVPVIRLARLAVRDDLQRTVHRLGETLLLNAVERAVEISSSGAGVAIAVDAKHGKAASFYMKYGFQPSPDNPLMLFLPMSACRQHVMAGWQS